MPLAQRAQLKAFLVLGFVSERLVQWCGAKGTCVPALGMFWTLIEQRHYDVSFTTV